MPAASAFLRLHKSATGDVLWRCFYISTISYQVNEEIRDREVRLISDAGEQLGIMPLGEAMEIAIEKDLDLVKIAPGSNPPVCKIMDYGKYRFEQSKREKEAKKNQHIVRSKRSACRRVSGTTTST